MSRVVAWVALTRFCGHVLLWRNLITVFFGVNTLHRRDGDAHRASSPSRKRKAPRGNATRSTMETATLQTLRRKSLVLSALRIPHARRATHAAIFATCFDATRLVAASTCTPRAGACMEVVPDGVAMTELRESARASSGMSMPRNEERRAVPGVPEDDAAPRAATVRITRRLRSARRSRREQAAPWPGRDRSLRSRTASHRRRRPR